MPVFGNTVLDSRLRGNDGSGAGMTVGGREKPKNPFILNLLKDKQMGAAANPYRRRLPFFFLTQVAVQGRS